MNSTTTQGTSEVRSTTITKAAVGVLTAKQAPHRPNLWDGFRRSVCAPGRCRRHSIADQLGKGERTMSVHSWPQNLRSALAPSRARPARQAGPTANGATTEFDARYPPHWPSTRMTPLFIPGAFLFTKHFFGTGGHQACGAGPPVLACIDKIHPRQLVRVWP